MNKLFRRANDWDKADKAQLTDGQDRGIKTTESRAIEAEEEKKRE